MVITNIHSVASSCSLELDLGLLEIRTHSNQIRILWHLKDSALYGLLLLLVPCGHSMYIQIYIYINHSLVIVWVDAFALLSMFVLFWWPEDILHGADHLYSTISTLLASPFSFYSYSYFVIHLPSVLKIFPTFNTKYEKRFLPRFLIPHLQQRTFKCFRKGDPPHLNKWHDYYFLIPQEVMF